MLESEFQQRQEPSWKQLDDRLDTLEKGKADADVLGTVQLFRDSCHDLSLARHRVYGHRLETRLNDLVIRAARFFRRPRAGLFTQLTLFLAISFPRALRTEWKVFLAAFLLFMLPAVAAWFGIADDLLWAQAILGQQGMTGMDQMYGGSEKLSREFDSDFRMWGFYIFNNVGICFRMFAGGMAAGIGTVFFLIFNGLQIGAAAAYVQHTALDPHNFWTFIIAHGSLEITGLIIVGASGLLLGGGILFPGPLNRRDSLFAAAQRALPLLGGGAIMVFLAAFIEGFWSAGEMSMPLKYGIGTSLWVLVVLWLYLGGSDSRRQPSREESP